MGRLGSAADVAGAVLFLVSAQATYITGETLHVNVACTCRRWGVDARHRAAGTTASARNQPSVSPVKTITRTGGGEWQPRGVPYNTAPATRLTRRTVGQTLFRNIRTNR